MFVIVAEQLFKQGAWGSSIFLIKCPPSLEPRRARQSGAAALAGAEPSPEGTACEGPQMPTTDGGREGVLLTPPQGLEAGRWWSPLCSWPQRGIPVHCVPGCVRLWRYNANQADFPALGRQKTDAKEASRITSWELRKKKNRGLKINNNGDRGLLLIGSGKPL